MLVERVKYLIWAKDVDRAVKFYTECFGATIERSNPAVTDLKIADATIGIHSGGDAKGTWTGISIQVSDVVSAADEVRAAGGDITRPISQDEGDDFPHLAMCVDTDGNQFMLTRKRS